MSISFFKSSAMNQLVALIVFALAGVALANDYYGAGNIPLAALFPKSAADLSLNVNTGIVPPGFRPIPNNGFKLRPNQPLPPQNAGLTFRVNPNINTGILPPGFQPNRGFPNRMGPKQPLPPQNAGLTFRVDPNINTGILPPGFQPNRGFPNRMGPKQPLPPQNAGLTFRVDPNINTGILPPGFQPNRGFSNRMGPKQPLPPQNAGLTFRVDPNIVPPGGFPNQPPKAFHKAGFSYRVEPTDDLNAMPGIEDIIRFLTA